MIAPLIAGMLAWPTIKAFDLVSDVVKLTEDWKAYYAHPPVEMIPPPVVYPPQAEPPKKPKKSFFQHPDGVSANRNQPLLSEK